MVVQVLTLFQLLGPIFLLQYGEIFFETLKITGAHGASVDLTNVSMFTHVVNANATGTTTIAGVQAGTTFGLTTSNDTNDSVTIDLQNENNTWTAIAGTTAAGVTLGTVTASDFETLNLVTQGGASSVNSARFGNA